jgi:Ribbon-Helix-Helix transcriptional regulator family
MKRLVAILLLAAAVVVLRRNLPGDLALGQYEYDRERLEARRSRGEPVEATVVGAATISEDVSPELARDAIKTLKVVGLLQATQEVQSALADRLTVVGTALSTS